MSAEAPAQAHRDRQRLGTYRWIIRKGEPGHLTNPDRPWQLWLSTGELMGLKAERSCHAFCVQVMDRFIEAYGKVWQQ